MKLQLIPLLALLSAGASAQETLFSEGTSFGGFGGPSARVYFIEDQTMLASGGKGGLLLGSERHEFTIGGAAYSGLVESGQRYTAGGLLVGYAHQTSQVFHPEVELLFGSVILGNKETPNEVGEFIDLAAGVEVNLFKFLRTGASLGYHVANTSAFDADAPSGWHIGIDFEFGGML